MSEKRFLGWEPTEWHEYEYDDAGRVVQVVVTREPEWDDEQREKMVALAQYEGGVGPCGYHHSVTADKSNHFTFETEVCPVCAGADQFARKLADDDEKAKQGNPPPLKPQPSDGRRMFARKLSPAEMASRAQQAGVPSRR